MYKYLITTAMLVAAATILFLFLGGADFFGKRIDDRVIANALKELEGNPDFTQGEALMDAGSFALAAQRFRTAAEQVTDSVQKVIAQSNLAVAYESTGDYRRAVAIFKEIAATEVYSPITRATAVQSLGRMYYRYQDPRITWAIFSTSTEPYTSMSAGNNIHLSYRRLFQYAVSLYPLALSEYSIADWYARAILNIKASPSAASATSTPALLEYYRQQLRERLTAAELDMRRMQADVYSLQEYVNALEQRATVLALVDASGDSSLGDVEAAYKEVLELYARHQLSGSVSARLGYADFLSQKYGEKRSADIQSILAPLTNKTLTDNRVNPLPYLQSAQRRTGSYQKTSLARIATLDPSFRTLLISAGWGADDLAY